VTSGTYTGDTNKTYALKITTAGLLGASTYKFSTDGGRTWNTNAPAPDLVTPANGVISLGDGVTLTFDDVSGTNPFGENDVFYVNATAGGYYQGNDENQSIMINRGTNDEYSLTGAEVFTAAGAAGVDIFRTLHALKDALASDAVANTADGTPVTAATLLRDIDGYTGYLNTDTIHLEGTDTDGNAVSDDTLQITDATSIGDLLGKIESVFGDVTASIASDGKLKVADNSTGASLLAVRINVRDAGNSLDSTLQFNDRQTFIIDQQKVLSDRIVDLQNAQKQILLNQADCGTKTAHLKMVKNNITTFDQSLSLLLAEVQDANVTELAMKMSMKEISLKTSYAIAAKIDSTSILDFLR
jgi:flagellin-like hook-associated protein FlgL